VRMPGLASEQANVSISVPIDRTGQMPRAVAYTPRLISRLKQLACAVGGLLDAAPCEWTKQAILADPLLSSLSRAATGVRQDLTGNFILRRGALVHSDVAMMGLAAPGALDLSPGRQSIKMSFSDGRQTALTQPDLHWEFARKLLDLVAAGGTTRPAPTADAMVRQWYIATSAWMQPGGHHDNDHIGRGREMFPDDPDLAMLAGAQHEAYATSSVQTAVRSAFLPTGVTLAVSSERSELRDAEKLLRRATELKPDFAEAQIRLGRVLAIMERDAEAADHLTRGVEGTDDRLLRYYGSLFLGAAEERLNHHDAAKASYQQAAALFPTAQSPLLGLSELARRAGRREEALQEMEKVYSLDLTGSLNADPWWTYNYAQGRDADALLEALQQPFRMSDER